MRSEMSWPTVSAGDVAPRILSSDAPAFGTDDDQLYLPVMASFMGKVTSPTGGRDGTLHYGRLDLNVYNPPSHIPDNYPVATGAAFAFQYRSEDRVALANCGDGSTSEGDFHEAVNSRRQKSAGACLWRPSSLNV